MTIEELFLALLFFGALSILCAIGAWISDMQVERNRRQKFLRNGGYIGKDWK